jgi:hypothetical protein
METQLPLKPRSNTRLVTTPKGRKARVTVTMDSAGCFYIVGKVERTRTKLPGSFPPFINRHLSERDMKKAEDDLLAKLDRYWDGQGELYG